VFACANPVPEIYPHQAKEAGAEIVATGRSDFPNQVNNSLGFPGILKGALLVRASQVTDGMAITAAHSLAESARKKGIHADSIMPMMTDDGLYPETAAAVATKAIEDGVARLRLSPQEVFARADHDIKEARRLVHPLMEQGFIQPPPVEMIDRVVEEPVRKIRPRG
jgi:malate dehydrogenase (oxaloacetate-decarboxylating)